MRSNNLKSLLDIFKRNVQVHYEPKSRNGLNSISRRSFVKNSAMASMTLGISSSILESCLSSGNKNTQPKVAIVGGGIAGLHAGHILGKSRINFTLFEASNRVGGRIFTVKNEFGENITTELGGEFIDSNHEDMINLVNEFGLDLYDTDDDIKKNNLIKDTYFFTERHYTENELIQEFSKYSKSIADDVQEVVELENEELINKLDAISISEYLKSKGINGWLFELLTSAYTSEYGLESSEQSSLNLVYMLNPDTKDGFKIFGDSDERFKIIGGNSLLTEKMYEKLKDSVKLNTELSKITEENGKYKLTFKNNDSSEFDFVILAIPFSVLRKIDIQVALPDAKIKAIKELGYGTTSKIIYGVNERVWRDNKYSGYLFSNEIQNGWDSSMGQNNNSGKGSYTVFLGGNLGKEVTKDNTTVHIQKLNQIFLSKKEIFNNKKLVFNWSSYPYSLGGYSAYKVGQWSTIAGKEKEPVNNLFFAGEHCSEDFQGYMNGGAETGRLAAEAVIKKLQEISEPKQK
ncbi:MAG: flavin monoamine oxidase family protein [Bacteroidota bacterium]|jgi:monoamine oxidase